jgi:WD40 repeat protein
MAIIIFIPGSNTVKVFDAAKGTLLYEWEKERDSTGKKQPLTWFRDVAISPDEKYIAASSADHTVKVWDLKTGKKVYSLVGDSW